MPANEAVFYQNQQNIHAQGARQSIMGPEERMRRTEYFQKIAETCIQHWNRNGALEMLKQAGDLWRTNNGQRAWQRMDCNCRADHLQKMAELYAQVGDSTEACKMLDAVHKQCAWQKMGPSDRANYYQKMANLYSQAGHPNGAIWMLKQLNADQDAWKQLPTEKRADHYQKMAELYTQLGDSIEACKMLKQDEEQWKTPEGEQAFKKLPIKERAGHYQKMAELYINVGDNAKAIKMLENIREEWNTDQGAWKQLPHKERVSNYQKMAELYIKAGNQNKAIEMLTAANTQWKSDNGRIAWNQLSTNERAGHYQKMAELYTQVGTLESKIEARNMLKQVTAQWQIDNWQAWGKLSLAERVGHFHKMTELYINAEDAAEARNMLKAAGAQVLDKNNKYHQVWLATPREQKVAYHNQRAELYNKLGDEKAAKFHRGLAWQCLWPNGRVEYFQKTAESHINAGKKEEAIRILNSVHKQWNNPEGMDAWRKLPIAKRAEYYQKMAELYTKADDKDTALKMLQQADAQAWDRNGNYHQAWIAVPQEQKVAYHRQQKELYSKLGDQAKNFVAYHDQQAQFESLSVEERIKSLQDKIKKNAEFVLGTNLLQQIDAQWKTPDGRQAWQKLGPNKRAEYYQIIANSCINNPNAALWIFQQLNADQETWNQLPIDRRMGHLQTMAGLYIRIGNKSEASKILQELDKQLKNEKGKQEFEKLKDSDRHKYYEAMGQLYKQIGNKKKASEMEANAEK
jgi:thioredoxin-like negative regulator of GroEL